MLSRGGAVDKSVAEISSSAPYSHVGIRYTVLADTSEVLLRFI